MAYPHAQSTRPSFLDQLRFATGEKVHIGIDTHKRSYPFAVHSERRGFLACWVQPADPTLLADKLRPLRLRIAWTC
jgi:hypothetical protein